MRNALYSASNIRGVCTENIIIYIQLSFEKQMRIHMTTQFQHDIEVCKQVYEHGIGNLCFGNNNGELGMILVNIRSIYKNFDRLVVLLGKFKKKAGNYLYIGD